MENTNNIPTAYEGKEPYIFVSYAHKDSARVLPFILKMQQAGLRVWFDKGIEAGTEWPEYIESHLLNADRVVVFMSEAAVSSANCRNEINLAFSEKKKILVVYLEETELRYGMKLQLSSVQSVYVYREQDEDQHIQEICNLRILSMCKLNAVPKSTSRPKIDNHEKALNEENYFGVQCLCADLRKLLADLNTAYDYHISYNDKSKIRLLDYLKDNGFLPILDYSKTHKNEEDQTAIMFAIAQIIFDTSYITSLTTWGEIEEMMQAIDFSCVTKSGMKWFTKYLCFLLCENKKKYEAYEVLLECPIITVFIWGSEEDKQLMFNSLNYTIEGLSDRRTCFVRICDIASKKYSINIQNNYLPFDIKPCGLEDIPRVKRSFNIWAYRNEQIKIMDEAAERGRQAYLASKENGHAQHVAGCYVATCVYGSYDCPEVWVLRRYRDNTLGANWYGRFFIRVYYAISPTLVNWFGETKWFKKLWRGKLDKMVKKLLERGVENTPYSDKEW